MRECLTRHSNPEGTANETVAAAILLQSTLTFSLQTDDPRGMLWSGEGQNASW